MSKHLEFLAADRVKYLCVCGSVQPLCRIYFCRHCLKLKCSDCVFHEVDSHYCSNCAENMPITEARLKKNRCDNCWDCPVCEHALSVRASAITAPSAEDPAKPISRRVYYLCCLFCRWSSRDCGIPDALGASGPWPDSEPQYGQRISQLTEYYRSLAQVEKIEQEQKRQKRRKQAFGDRLGGSARKRTSGLHVTLAGLSIASPRAASQPPLIEASIPTEEEEELSEDFINQPVQLNTVLSLDQRLRYVDRQPTTTEEILPLKKSLMIRRSQRCRRCEHNLCKPEYNPSSIKFKIHLGGYHHVPEIIIYSMKKQDDGEISLVLRLCNRSQHPTNVQLLPIEELGKVPIAVAKTLLETQKASEPAETQTTPLSLVSARVISDQLTPLEEIQVYEAMAKNAANVAVSGSISLPNDVIQLPPRDDLAEYESSSMTLLKDDPKCVIWRRSNKVGVQTTVKPTDSPALVGLVVQWQTIRAGAPSDAPPSVAQTTVFVKV